MKVKMRRELRIKQFCLFSINKVKIQPSILSYLILSYLILSYLILSYIWLFNIFPFTYFIYIIIRDMSNIPNYQKLYLNSVNSKEDRLKQIEELYRSQIKQIYDRKQIVAEKQKQTQLKRDKTPTYNASSSITNSGFSSGLRKVSSNQNFQYVTKDVKDEDRNSLRVSRPSDDSRISKVQTSIIGASLAEKKDLQQRGRPSMLLQNEAIRKMDELTKQNQAKQLRIRELVFKCEGYLQKLKKHMSPNQLSKQLESLNEYSDNKMERLENLFKIKNEEMFFKMKVQIQSLLKQFQISDEEVDGIKETTSESALFSFMVRKLKSKLKDFRLKEQESNYEIQKDKVLNQKNEQRIQYLIQTNDLLKLSQTKLKSKIEDLRSQMNQFLQKLKQKELQIEQKQGEIFRLKKQNEQLQSTNQKLGYTQRSISNQRTDQKKVFEAKEKEYKQLLNSYYNEKKKFQIIAEEREGEVEELRIQIKMLEQQNEKINRQFVRWKERYEWLEKEKQNRQRQNQQQKAQIINQFVEYRNSNNQTVYQQYKNQTEEALKRINQLEYELSRSRNELQQEKRIRRGKQQEARVMASNSQRQWVDKIRRIQKLKQSQIYEIAQQHQLRQHEIRRQYEKRQELITEQMQVRMKALLAENDRKATEKIMELENQNQELRKQIQNISRFTQIKSMVSGMNGRKFQ